MMQASYTWAASTPEAACSSQRHYNIEAHPSENNVENMLRSKSLDNPNTIGCRSPIQQHTAHQITPTRTWHSATYLQHDWSSPNQPKAMQQQSQLSLPPRLSVFFGILGL